MTVGTINFCYIDDVQSKLDVLDALKLFFKERKDGGYVTYVPVPDNGYNVNTTMSLYDDTQVVFASIKSLTPAMEHVFQNGINLKEHRIVSIFNGTVYDYAVNVVKELLQDDNIAIVELAIGLASEYRLCSMSRMPYGYHVLRGMRFSSLSSVKECGKALAGAIN